VCESIYSWFLIQLFRMLGPIADYFAMMQVFAELKDLHEKITSAQLVSPTLIIIGKVVELSPFWPIPTKEESCLMQA